MRGWEGTCRARCQRFYFCGESVGCGEMQKSRYASLSLLMFWLHGIALGSWTIVVLAIYSTAKSTR